MDFPITLDDQLGFVAVEVADVVAKLVISAELGIVELAIPDQLPKEPFGFGVLGSEFPRTLLQTGKIKSSPIVSAAPSLLGRGLG